MRQAIVAHADRLRAGDGRLKECMDHYSEKQRSFLQILLGRSS